jgi:membrane protein
MANPIAWGIEKIKRLNELIWHNPKNEIGKWESFIYKQLKIIILAARGFRRDKVQLRASALTFYSLLSLIPLIAIAFAIAKGFGLDAKLEQTIIENVRFGDDVTDFLLETSRTALERTSGGYIAGVGIVILFVSVMALLENIESSFNHIWQVRAARPWYRKFTDYFTFLLIAPIFIILSSSLMVFVNTEMTEIIDSARILAFFKPVVKFLLKFAPYLFFWISMTILFVVMPYTKVKFVPALIAGVITGTILHLLQWLYFEIQYGMMSLNAIYGSLALIPLFVVWMQSSWIIVLIGAELAYANQNIGRFEQEFESVRISYFQKRAIVLMMMQKIVRNFYVGEKPLSAEELAVGVNIPVRLARDILQDLSNINLVSVVQENGSEQLYQPAIDINKLTISYIFSRMDRKGSSHITISKNEDYNKVVNLLEKFDRQIASSDNNVLIKDL